MHRHRDHTLPQPVAAAGVVALHDDHVLLVKRGKAPAKDQWSLPGGAIHPGERAATAAHREALEETGLVLRILDVVGVYDGIYPGSDRHPGFHYCVSNFLAVPENAREPDAGSDARDARWAPLDQLDAYGVTDGIRQTVAAAVARLRSTALDPLHADVAGLYVVTDDTLFPGRSHLDVASAAVSGGARTIQLRDKRRDTGELIDLARAMLALTRSAGATLIVNDRVDVALASGADGVHLGTEDMTVADARRLLGPRGVIGYSPETAEQAGAAARDGADYLGVGDLFGTATKADAGAPVGLDHLERMRAASGLPVVGIGGITRREIPQVMAAGAVGVAVVGAVVKADDMVAATQSLCQTLAAATRHQP